MIKNPQEVFESHLKAVSTLNPQRVIEDYATDSILITQEQTYKGSSEILKFYEDLLPKMEGFEIKTIKQETNDNIVYLAWYGTNKNIEIKFATDTYIVENGKIQYHTFSVIIK